MFRRSVDTGILILWRNDSDFLLSHALPSGSPGVWYAEVIQYAEDQMIHEGFNSLWLMVKAGTSGNNMRASA